MMNKNLIFVLLILLLLFIGCSNKVELGGKVTFSDDGTPLGVGEVCFETDTYFARGKLKPDGSYVVGSLSAKDGIPPGNYRVYIIDAEEKTGEKDKFGTEITEQLIDIKFTSSLTSGLTADVSKSLKRFDFKVDRYTGQK
ncbi:MAG: hypothetical protein LBJ00_11395 [Planctomycetaceae bacterium]|jgi:hypothetical protein|nr:hypothetical protein [Planctomycetaceae bacterium]